jgi:hypothetical protein
LIGQQNWPSSHEHLDLRTIVPVSRSQFGHSTSTDRIHSAARTPGPLLRNRSSTRVGVQAASPSPASSRRRSERRIVSSIRYRPDVVEHHQALVDESGDDVEHRVGIDVVERSQHRLGAFQEPADEYSETAASILVVDRASLATDAGASVARAGRREPP